MNAAAIVTIVAVVVVVLVIVVFLLAIARVLVGVDKSLGVVIGAVGVIAEKTAPVAYVVDSLNSNLGASSGALSSLLESKVGAADAAQLVASVDPLAATPAALSEPASSLYKRASPEAAEAEPVGPARVNPRTGTGAPSEPAPARIEYQRANPDAGTEAPSEPAPVAQEPVAESPRRPFPGAGGEIRLGGRPIKK